MADDNSDRLIAAYETWAGGELERIPEYFHPDGVYRPSGLFPGMKAIYRGHGEIESLWHWWIETWDCFEIEVTSTVEVGDRVAAEVRFTGRGAGSGVEVTADVAQTAEFRDGLIVELRAFGSPHEAWDAVGLEPASAG